MPETPSYGALQPSTTCLQPKSAKGVIWKYSAIKEPTNKMREREACCVQGRNVTSGCLWHSSQVALSRSPLPSAFRIADLYLLGSQSEAAAEIQLKPRRA